MANKLSKSSGMVPSTVLAFTRRTMPSFSALKSAWRRLSGTSEPSASEPAGRGPKPIEGTPYLGDVDFQLKSWVGLFQPIYDGEKTHDIRVMDRNYEVGNILLLKEFEPRSRDFTGRWAKVEVTYITSNDHVPCAFSPIALHPASGVLSIKLNQRGGTPAPNIAIIKDPGR